MDSWAVASLADEPGALVAAFVAFHLEQGAAEVHVCLDRPNEEARDLLAGVPGAVLSDAGADGWSFMDRAARPEGHLGRQKYHASRVLSQTAQDWVVHCDADEFVLPVDAAAELAPEAADESGAGPERGAGPGVLPVGAVLGAVRRGASWMKLDVAERVQATDQPGGDIFSGLFRLPWAQFATQGPALYDEAQMLLLNRGVCGHQLGKAAVRSGRGLFLGVHRPMRAYGGAGRDVPFDGTRQLRLLHFDGLTRLHYALKMVRRALALQVAHPPSHAPHRLLQIEALAGAGADARAIDEQWQAAKTITPAQAQALFARNVLRDYRPEIAAAAARVLPQAPDLTPRAFDHALLTREAELLARAQEAFGFDPAPFVAS